MAKVNGREIGSQRDGPERAHNDFDDDDDNVDVRAIRVQYSKI